MVLGGDSVKNVYQEIIIVITILIYCRWKKYHTKYLAKHSDVSIKTEIISMIYAAVTAIMLIFVIVKWGWFSGIYIALPIAVVGMYLLRKKDVTIEAFYLILKGVYYLTLFIYSIIQYYSESDKLAESAIGFTISLAIFESATALSDGVNKINEEKKRKEK